MIDTLFFLLQIIGFLVLLAWAVIHDRFRADGETVGPMAFKPSGTVAAKPSQKRRPRSGLTRHRGEANLEDQNQ